MIELHRYYKTKYGNCIVLKKYSQTNFLVQFENTKFITKTNKYHILHDEVKDLRYPKVCGIGYLGDDYKKIRLNDPVLCKKLRYRWKAMLDRCYNKNNSNYFIYGGKGVKVSNEWHCFCNYFKDVQSLPNWDKTRFLNGELSIDKDYLQPNIKNKIYSKNTCVWLNNYEQQQLVDYNLRRKSIIVIFPDGHEVKYNGIRTFAREYNLNEKNVSACVNRKRKSCKCFKFKKCE